MRNESISPREFFGVYTAEFTPLIKSQGGNFLNVIDYGKAQMHLDDQIKANVDGIVFCGTTGQSSTMCEMPHVHAIETGFYMVDGRTRVIAGAGSNNTEEAIKRTREIEKRIGPTTFLHETGYKNNPTQKGLYEHFKTIAENFYYGDSNLIMYNVPGRTGSNLEAATIIELAKLRQIIGLKEASGNYSTKVDGDMTSKVVKIVAGTNPDNFRVVSGEDDLIARVIELGGYGTISASANAAPLYFKDLVDEANMARKSGTSFENVYEIQKELMPLISAVFMRKNPIPLAIMFGTDLKLPMTREDEIVNSIYDVLLKYDSKKTGTDFAKYNKDYARYMHDKAA